MAVVFLLFIAIFPALSIIGYIEGLLQQHGEGRYQIVLWSVYVLAVLATVSMGIYMVCLLLAEMFSGIGGAGVGPT